MQRADHAGSRTSHRGGRRKKVTGRGRGARTRMSATAQRRRGAARRAGAGSVEEHLAPFSSRGRPLEVGGRALAGHAAGRRRGVHGRGSISVQARAPGRGAWPPRRGSGALAGDLGIEGTSRRRSSVGRASTGRAAQDGRRHGGQALALPQAGALGGALRRGGGGSRPLVNGRANHMGRSARRRGRWRARHGLLAPQAASLTTVVVRRGRRGGRWRRRARR